MNTSLPYQATLMLMLLGSTIMSCSFQKRPALAETDASLDPLRYEIVEHAKTTVGSGYRYGATGTNRYDCSGLVYTLFQAQDVSLPRSTNDMARFGEKIKLQDVEPGDLIFFRNVRKIDHVALVSRKSPTKTWLIHSTTSRGVVEEVLEESYYWSTRVDQCRRFIP